MSTIQLPFGDTPIWNLAFLIFQCQLVNLLTCQLVNLSTCQLVNLSTCQLVNQVNQVNQVNHINHINQVNQIYHSTSFWQDTHLKFWIHLTTICNTHTFWIFVRFYESTISYYSKENIVLKLYDISPF